MKNRMNKQAIGGLFLAAILLLTFFSKTIYSYYLPEVTAVKPFNGQLNYLEVAYGTAKWVEVDSIYIPAEGMVGELYVNEGEYVEAGQVLFSMEYDRDENDRKLKEFENTRQQLVIALQTIESQVAAAAYPDAELLQAKQAVEEAENYLNAAELLHSIGGVSTQELLETRNKRDYLRLKLENMTREAEERKESLELEWKAKTLELENLAITEESCKKIQGIHDTEANVTAKRAGMLQSFYISKGEKVGKDILAARVGTGDDYVLECSVLLENSFIAPGDVCSLSNSSHKVRGIVSGVVPSEQDKTVNILFTAEGVTAGETFEVLFQKESVGSYILVPNEAVNLDNDGYYLKQLKRRDGIMGKEYYLDRLNIYVGESDSENTAVIQGITFFEPVMLSSDKKADTKDVVVLKNAGDFFEE